MFVDRFLLTNTFHKVIDEAEIELDEMAGKSDRELKLEVLKHTSEKMQEEAEEEEETFKEIEQMEGAPTMENPEDQVGYPPPQTKNKNKKQSRQHDIELTSSSSSSSPPHRNIFEMLLKLYQC